MKKIKILFISVSESTLNRLLKHFESCNIEVLHNSTLQTSDSLILLKNEIWDFIITEINFKSSEIYTVLELVAKIDSDLPVLVVSEAVPSDMYSDLMSKGAVDVISTQSLEKLYYITNREIVAYRTKVQQRQMWDMLIHTEELLTRSQILAKLGHFEIIYPDQRVLWSLELYKILGYPYAEIPTIEKIFDRIHISFRAKIRDIWEKLSAKEEIHEEQVELIVGGDKKIVNLSIESEEIGGGLVRYFGTIHDITEKILLERAYAEAQKLEALGTFAGSIAHDFNNVLTPMMTYITYLKNESDSLDGKSTFERKEKAIDGLYKSLERAKSLTSQILNFSKTDQFSLIPINLTENLKSIISELRGSGNDPIEVILNLEEKNTKIDADPIHLYQIISNLYENASFAVNSVSNPKILIQLRSIVLPNSKLKNLDCLKKGNYLELQFSDNGTGIHTDTIDRIFDPFFTTKGGKGTGLGLPIAFGLMKKMGGTITVNSEVGKGTIFSLYFPLK